MGRSKESLKRKRSSRSKDSGYYAKRQHTNAGYSTNLPKREIFSQTTTDNLTQSFCDVVTYPQIPYYSWTTYFNSQEYNEDSTTVLKIDALIAFFERPASPSISFDPENRVDLDINSCLKDPTLLRKWPSFVKDFNVKPQYTLNCISVALFEVMMRRTTMDEGRSVAKRFRILQLNRINMTNYETSISVMPCVKLSAYGKLIAINCRVIGAGSPKLVTASVVFVCKCNRQIIAKQQSETCSVPTKCNVCGNGSFKRLLDSPYEITRVSQTIHVKDHRRVDQMVDDGAISPSIVGVNLESSLLDKFMPGDSVRVIGIPRVMLCSEYSHRITLGGGKSTTAGSCPLYIDAISIFRDNDHISSIHVNGEAIQRVKSESDVFSLLVHSLCPSVQGHEIIKAALVLGLVGGSFQSSETRNSIHTLIIGNLGLGKSQLLRSCVQAAAQGVYIRGSSSATLEPTIINVRENGTEDFRLESGGFASANQGLCCIDELDKSSARHQVITKFMEWQRVSVTNPELKYGAVARTSIFGIIDPIRKHYDTSKTVADNVNANHQLLSQFDMVFLMRDNPNTYCDKLMCDRVLDVHTKRVRLGERTPSSGNRTKTESHADRERSLREMLVAGSISDILPQKLLRMYINYARSYIRPEISRTSEAVIELFCLLRYRKDKELTKLERLFRTLVVLIQARAKIDLRAETTERDAYDVTEILEHAVSIDTKDRPPSSCSKSSKLTGNKIKQFLDDLRNEATSLNKSTFTTDELRNIAGKENVTGNSLSTLLSRLNEQGYLLKVSNSLYRVVLD